ncbi:MFS transporter [[Actinomadura] parvosata]|uniref:MFS transporter n=1 Tax=[Actinomadura] parvosata TaxID=1955412 RepID=UPI00406CC6BC
MDACLAFAVIEAGGGAAALGLVLMGGLLVFIAVTPAAGVLADRLPRLSIIVACQIICGVCQLVAAVLVLRGAAEVWSLVALQMVAGAAGAFFQPAVKGLVPQLVPPAVKGLVPQLVPPGPMLSHANALLQIADNAVAILGPGLAGLVIALSSPGIILAWDGATFLASAALFRTLRLPPSPRRERRRFLADLGEGWAAGVSVLGPVYATRYLDGAVGWGLVTSAIGIGLACGSITSPLFPPTRVGRLMCLAPIPVALPLIGMATGAPLLALAGAGALTGAGGTLQLIAWTSYLQQAIPAEQLSRIVATNALIATLLVPVAYAMAGPAAEVVGVRGVLGGCAVIVLGGAAFAACSRDVRQLIKAT